MNKSLLSYSDVIVSNRKKFEKMISKINASKNIKKKVYLAKKAIDYVIFHGTGYYSSKDIENVFLEIAEKNNIENFDCDYEKNSFLHIMTNCYKDGGHTRVVERWLELSDDNQKHSLLFTGAAEVNPIPNRLGKAVENKNGSIINLSGLKNDIAKGLELRKIASKYEYIILHIHMHDIIPIIAFGNKQFQRPVIFYNHADHFFWVGVSIIDKIAELREFGKNLSENSRGINNGFILGVPVDSKEIPFKDKRELRKKFNLPEDKKIIFTGGTDFKYIPMAGKDFLTPVLNVLINDENVVLVGVGPNFKTLPNWAEAAEKTNGRVIAFNTVPHEDYYNYIQASDVVIDSYPMSGGMAIIDAISCAKPVITRDTPVGLFDYIKNSDAFCNTEEEVSQKIKELLYDKNKCEKNIQSVKSSLAKINVSDKWKLNLQKLYETVPETHSIHDFKENVCEISDLDIFHYLNSQKRKRKRSLFQRIISFSNKYGSKVLTFLGKEFIIKSNN